VLYILLPLSLPAALILCSLGVLETFHPYRQITTLEGARQTIALGPVASQEPIKLLGSDGGGSSTSTRRIRSRTQRRWRTCWRCS